MAVSQYCIKEDAKCPYKQTSKQTFAIAPFPDVFLININWFSDHTSYMETFYFSLSIAMEFNMSDMFEVESKSSAQARESGKGPKSLQPGSDIDKVDEQYVLMGLVCFVGAHYFTFIKSE